MNLKFNPLVLLALTCLTFVGCDNDDEHQPTPVKDLETVVTTGDSTLISSKVNAFRERAGNPVNVTPGATTGRREINWDAVPSDLLNKNTFPADFFGATDKALPDLRKRGIVFTPATASLRISNNNLSDVDPAYGSQFSAFSKKNIFTPIGTNITEFKFQVPGTDKHAYVSSFGVIFSDVDNADATVVEAYEGDALIGKVKAQSADKKFSFVGLHHKSRKITRIKVISGNKVIAAGIADGTTTDLVAMDDLIYSEPKAY